MPIFTKFIMITMALFLAACGDSSDDKSEGRQPIVLGTPTGEYTKISKADVLAGVGSLPSGLVEVTLKLYNVKVEDVTYGSGLMKKKGRELKLDMFGVNNLDISVKSNSPLFKKLIELSPSIGMVTVKGDIKLYGSDYSRGYMYPDVIILHPDVQIEDASSNG